MERGSPADAGAPRVRVRRRRSQWHTVGHRSGRAAGARRRFWRTEFRGSRRRIFLVSFAILRRFSVVLLAVAALATLSFAPAPAAAQDVDPLSRLDPNSRFAIELILDSARID